MNSYDIEKYQILLQENPRSKVFAPLADAYRKMGMLKEAAEVAEMGIHYNPDFAGGRVVMGRILMERDDHSQAIEELRKATELDPENILAHLLLAENFIAEKRSKDALRAFKMVLFLNPQHKKARTAVQKLESLTADEFDDELFSMSKLSPLEAPQSKGPAKSQQEPPHPPPSANNTLLDRHLSLVDAFVARNEIEKALLR
ncbi:MAG: tetratricopeptide repeat protein [Bdellovibrionales bacterium]